MRVFKLLISSVNAVFGNSNENIIIIINSVRQRV
uniref:Uncharacterized protein n=1 Tax=Pyricularia oryzae (strain P131) TaxID=1143193 RepID=L7J7L7_PYRO1